MSEQAVHGEGCEIPARLNGLSSIDARRLLVEVGPNRWVKQDRFAGSRGRQSLLDPMAVMLIVAAVVYFLLGESEPQSKREWPSTPGEAPPDARFSAGSQVMAGHGFGLVTTTGAATQYGGIAALVARSASSASPLGAFVLGHKSARFNHFRDRARWLLLAAQAHSAVFRAGTMLGMSKPPSGITHLVSFITRRWDQRHAPDGFESVMLRNMPPNRAGSLRSTTSPVP